LHHNKHSRSLLLLTWKIRRVNIDNNVNFELKYGFIHFLPTFNGLAGEDPHSAFNVLIIKYPISYSFNISMKD
jgi:hypothetical protein